MEVLSPKDLTELSLHLAEEQDEHHHHHHHHHHHLQQPLVISPQNEVMTHVNREWNFTEWTKEEDKMLCDTVAEYSKTLAPNVSFDWSTILQLLLHKDPTCQRSAMECQSRWYKLIRGKTRGTWLKEEDQIVIESVKKGFKYWREISNKIPGRTPKQCRERWLQILNPNLSRSSFTAVEDEIILRLQAEFGNKWACIASQLEGRSGQQVKARYELLQRRITSGYNWKLHADNDAIYGSKSEYDPNRDKDTEAQIKQMQQQAQQQQQQQLALENRVSNQLVTNPSIPMPISHSMDLNVHPLLNVTGDDGEDIVDGMMGEMVGDIIPDTESEYSHEESGHANVQPNISSHLHDLLFSQMQASHSSSQYQQIFPHAQAQSIPHEVVDAQLPQGQSSMLSNNIPSSPFSPRINRQVTTTIKSADSFYVSRKWLKEEDLRLAHAVEVIGRDPLSGLPKWKEVANFVRTRDPSQCQMRWNKIMHPDRIRGHWREEEDERLTFLASKGVVNWSKIAAEMVGRSAKQCRERWTNYLDPKNLRTRFSLDEDEKLISLHAQLGNHWAQIARLMPGRSEQVVKGRYRLLTSNHQRDTTASQTKRTSSVLSSSNVNKGSSRSSSSNGGAVSGELSSEEQLQQRMQQQIRQEKLLQIQLQLQQKHAQETLARRAKLVDTISSLTLSSTDPTPQTSQQIPQQSTTPPSQHQQQNQQQQQPLKQQEQEQDEEQQQEESQQQEQQQQQQQQQQQHDVEKKQSTQVEMSQTNTQSSNQQQLQSQQSDTQSRQTPQTQPQQPQQPQQRQQPQSHLPELAQKLPQPQSPPQPPPLPQPSAAQLFEHELRLLLDSGHTMTPAENAIYNKYLAIQQQQEQLQKQHLAEQMQAHARQHLLLQQQAQRKVFFNHPANSQIHLYQQPALFSSIAQGLMPLSVNSNIHNVTQLSQIPQTPQLNQQIEQQQVNQQFMQHQMLQAHHLQQPAMMQGQLPQQQQQFQQQLQHQQQQQQLQGQMQSPHQHQQQHHQSLATDIQPDMLLDFNLSSQLLESGLFSPTRESIFLQPHSLHQSPIVPQPSASDQASSYHDK